MPPVDCVIQFAQQASHTYQFNSASVLMRSSIALIRPQDAVLPSFTTNHRLMQSNPIAGLNAIGQHDPTKGIVSFLFTLEL